MKIGFGFYGITDGTDERTGYSRNYKHCWNGIQKYLIQPFVDKGNEAVIYASTYPFTTKESELEFISTVKPKKILYSDFATSDAFTSKSALHDAFVDEDLDVIIFTRFDIHFTKIIANEDIDFSKFNFLFPEDENWWRSHRFACDCFYIWNHKYSNSVKDAMRETYGWPRGTFYPDTHGLINFLDKKMPSTELHFISKICEISNVNTFYTLCRKDVPEHPCKHPEVKAKYG